MHHLYNRYRHYLNVQNGTIVLALLIAMGWMWGTVQTLQKNFRYQQEVDALTQNVELEQLRNQNLEYQQQYYRSDEFLELSARQRLGKANPGEKLIILPDSDSLSDTAGGLDAPIGREQVSNLSQWTEFFFGDKQQP